MWSRAAVVVGVMLLSGPSWAELTWSTWDSGPGHNYHQYAIYWQAGTWPEAYAFARAQDAYLVTVLSAEEEAWLMSAFPSEWTQNTWMGLTDSEGYRGEESHGFGWPDRRWRGWVWLEDGVPVPLTPGSYMNWDPGCQEPNNAENGEDFGALNWWSTGKWNDWDVGHIDTPSSEWDKWPLRAILERNPVPEPSSLTLLAVAVAAGGVLKLRRRRK